MKNGSIAFIMNHKNPISKVIAWAMGSQWSHSAVVVGEVAGEKVSVETSDFEVYMTPFSTHLDPNASFEVYEPIEDQPVELTYEAMGLVGQVYGYLQLISLGIRRLLMLVGIKIPNFIRVGLVCCAVPGYAYKKGTVQWLKDLDPESYDTEELYQMIKSAPEFRLSHRKPQGTMEVERVN
jgi:hypothetical protein